MSKSSRAHRTVGEHRQARRADFGEAADDHDRLARAPLKMVTMPGRNAVTSGAWPARMPMSPSAPGKST